MILRNAVPDGVPNSTYTQLPQKKLPRCGNTKRDRNGDKYMEDFQSRQTTTGLSPAEHNLEWPEYVAQRVWAELWIRGRDFPQRRYANIPNSEDSHHSGFFFGRRRLD